MLTDAVVSIGLHSHTHSSLSLCLSATLPFPLSLKRCCDTAILINRNIDFSVFGSLISKVTPTSNYLSLPPFSFCTCLFIPFLINISVMMYKQSVLCLNKSELFVSTSFKPSCCTKQFWQGRMWSFINWILRDVLINFLRTGGFSLKLLLLFIFEENLKGIWNHFHNSSLERLISLLKSFYDQSLDGVTLSLKLMIYNKKLADVMRSGLLIIFF